MLQLNVGDPENSETDVGPMAREDLAKELEEQMNTSIQKNAVLRKGGKREKALFYPTILENIKPGIPAFDDELFGPIAPFTKISSLEEAIELGNQSDFGLGVSIYTKDIEAALNALEDIEDGAVFINSIVKSDPRLPFGGTKTSGYGRELAEDGIKEFVNKKTVYIG